MSKIDPYLRSIGRFGATGALLVSGQSITLRFPTGDRHATQVTPHELLVVMLREVAPPSAWANLEANRRARFELESGDGRFAIDVTPRAGSWQVAIEVQGAGAPPASAPPVAPTTGERSGRIAAPAAPERVVEAADTLSIERTPYDDAGGDAGSGSAWLDQLRATALALGASELLLSTGAPAMARVRGAWQPLQGRPLDGDALARELGVMAPPAARASWAERGEGTFAFADARGRLRVHLARDARGPRAAIRLIAAEPPELRRLGLPEVARRWLRQRRGLIVLAGSPGSGRSTTLAAITRALLEDARRAVVTLEDPVELVLDSSALLSQREVGAHVASLAAGVRSAVREGAEVIAVARCGEEETAYAIGEAVEAGLLVLAVVDATSAAAALAALAEPRGPGASRQREAIAAGALGVLVQELRPAQDGERLVAEFEVVSGSVALAEAVRAGRWDLLADAPAPPRDLDA
ncbi:MAG: ATPase, T2SS/T4P/T4SS family [Kofleriaceae bacterium]